ncbi:GntR family transcriptional regulator [Thalassospira sp. TSL5-1]|uniref:GntR family transcriptional regulator n=1 Tax=Thalassospira sp. TSL5-1 TaxID=1544451 RepID=UPI00143AD1E8|nr:GntR family transcriptional regulator [Thalassospira sp. TSL5-1]
MTNNMTMTKPDQPDPHSSTPQNLTERIRADILIGAYRPGEWLRQMDLQETYQATRFQIRRALDDLVLMGLAEHVPNRGIRLVSPSTEERHQMTEVRVILEREAALSLVENVRDADITLISNAAEAFDRAIEGGSYATLRQLNHHFHRAMNRPLPNTIMANLLNDLRERDLPGSWTGWAGASGLKASSQQHLDMVDALRARDGERLSNIITLHINRWKTQP